MLLLLFLKFLSNHVDMQRYRGLREIGKGAFGVVFLAQGIRDNKLVVIKTLDNLRQHDLKVVRSSDNPSPI